MAITIVDQVRNKVNATRPHLLKATPVDNLLNNIGSLRYVKGIGSGVLLSDAGLGSVGSTIGKNTATIRSKIKMPGKATAAVAAPAAQIINPTRTTTHSSTFYGVRVS